ncbi:DOPA 4,5-dioxygenase family protein [Hydrogenophaga sp.]|uniref:DOPA 4,5-dioxygenase family protein n=1 Tax=Hydrogenophaga sp. TaxID=1904254 RepID=UPI003568F4F7
MPTIKRPVNVHKAYHAHVYFDADTLDLAVRLCEQAGQQFAVQVGRVHQKLVGPHPRWSCQLAFSHHQFDALVPWLDEHRQGLTVFVHGLTGDDLKDHTDYAYWLGESAVLDLSVFDRA